MAVEKKKASTKSKAKEKIETVDKEMEITETIVKKQDAEIEMLKKKLDALSKQVAEKEEEKTIEIEEKKSKVSTKKELRQDAKNIEVEIVNMTNGELYYRCKKSREELSLSEKGDSEVVSLDYLLTMRNQHRTLLERMDLVIVDVYGDYDLSDIVDYLGLDKIYQFEKIDVDFIENAINDMDASEFEHLVNNSQIGLVVKIAERGIQLAKEGKFDSYTKRQAIARKFGKEDLFEI